MKKETHVPTFDTTLQTTHEWLKELEYLAALRSQADAYTVLRQLLDHRISVGELSDVYDAMPEELRALWSEAVGEEATAASCGFARTIR